MDPTGRSAKSQFKLADREGAAYAITVGDTELSAGNVVLKNFKTTEQMTIARDQIVSHLQSLIAAR
jgi:histidyl-tRNA synthetase